jgi:hypothetical protein
MSDKIYYNDLTSTANLTPSSQTAGKGIEYIHSKTTLTKWRTTGIAGESVLFEFATATNIKAVIYNGTNIDSGDTIFSIQAGTTAAVSDESQNLTKADKGIGVLDWTYKFFKINITKASGTYIEFGKIGMMGSEYEFVRNYKWGYGVGFDVVWDQAEGFFGQDDRELRFTGKRFNLQFGQMKTIQKELFDETIRNEPYIYYFDNDNSVIWYGKGDWSEPRHNRGDNWSIALNFKELK